MQALKALDIPRGQRLIIGFPIVVATLSGCHAIEVGAYHVWVNVGQERRRILRSAFTPAELSDVTHNLAFRARQLAFPEL